MAVDVASVSSSVYYCHSSGVTNNFCRICATNDSGNLFSIFSKEGELWDVAEKIGRCLPIIVLPTDTLPLHICVRCLMKLNASYELVITALNSEAKLKSQFELEEDSCMQLEELRNQQSLSVQIKQEESDDVKKEELNSVDGSSPSLEKKVENSHLLEDVSDRNHKHLELYEDTNTHKLQSLPEGEESSRKHQLPEMCKQTANINSEDVEMDDSDQMLPVEIPSLTIYGPATCDLCDKTFTDMDEFDDHVMIQHLKKQKWQCLRCDDSFENSQELVMHKVISHNEEPISCEQCAEKRVKDESTRNDGSEEEWLEETEVCNKNVNLNNNVGKNINLELYCDLCDRNFLNETKLKDHYLIHTPRTKECNKCGIVCSCQELTNHKKSRTRQFKEKRFICGICRKPFADRILLSIHSRHCGSKQYTCNICDRTFWREYSLQLHMKVHKLEDKYVCDCGLKFDSHSLFLNHKKTHEGTHTMQCVTCDKVFTNETFYKRHRYIHDPEYWDRFKCQTCHRPFRDAHALKNHMQLHTGMKSYMCEICGRTYNRYANMVKHRKLHKPQNLWEHNCSHCEAKFERLKDLMSHIEHVHSIGVIPRDNNGEDTRISRKWICRFCGKRISTKLSLQDHERIHTGAKPYICEWCGREFRSRPNLLQHHLTHTGDRKHACGLCGKKFARKSFIAQHMRVHTGEKPFECDICFKRFTQAGDMRRHRIRHAQQQKEQVALFVEIQQ